MWYERYVNVPFLDKGRDENGADCWGLASVIYKNELKITLPDYLEFYENTNEREKLSALISSESQSHWVSVKEPKEFDVVVLNMRGVPMHVGIVTKPNHMIHCARGIGTTHEHYGTARWKHKVMGFYRWNQ